MTPEWQVALDAKVDIVRFWQSSWAERFAAAMVAMAMRREPDRPPLGPMKDFVEPGHVMALLADPVFVSPDMMRLVEAASRTFQPESVLETDMLVRVGLAYLPWPLRLPALAEAVPADVPTGLEMAIRVINWAVAPDVTGKLRVNLNLFHAMADADTLKRGTREMRVPFPFVPELTLNWPLSEPWTATHLDANPVGTDDLNDLLGLFLQVLWRLMLQTISVKDKKPVEKHAQKRAARMELPESDVLVVTLRRPKHKDPESEVDVQWSHRWMVEGHWRNQPYPSEGVHRQIWISPYIKGPEDKPFVPHKGRVFDFVR
jgi:hypothetical protein